MIGIESLLKPRLIAQVLGLRAFISGMCYFSGHFQAEFEVTSQRSEAEFGTLPGLFRQYLEKRAAAHATSLAEAGLGEVVPFESVPIQPPDPKAAWDAALEAARFYGVPALPKVPANWPDLVAQCAPELALPFCLGNYPQLVRDLAPFVEPADLTRLRPTVSRSPRRANMVQHSDLPKPPDNPIQILFSVASFRLTKEFDQAAELLRHYRDKIAPSTRQHGPMKRPPWRGIPAELTRPRPHGNHNRILVPCFSTVA